MRMNDVIGIRYVTAGPIDYCGPSDLQPGLGDYVVVEKDGGEQLGWVVMTPDQVISATIERPLRVIERLASEDDVLAWRSQKERAEEDIGRAQEVAARTDPRVRVATIVFDLSGEHGEMTFTGQENTSYAWLREDMSELLEADVHVELVGDRDRAKGMGPGVMGVCGRELCCTSWMTSFPSVSIRMAKEQGLSPNPSKISGLCGRLLCCLSFEVDAYKELRGDLPKVGKRVTTPSGRAKVLSVDALAQKVRMRLDETGEIIEIPADELRQQYGTVVRPEELESAIEEPARAEATSLARNTIAVLEPVTERATDLPLGITPGRRRRRPGAGSSDVPSESRREPAGEKSKRRRRRRSRSGVDGAATTEQGSGVVQQASDASRGEASGSRSTEEQGEAGDPKRRRRGRRGGRRRRGRGAGELGGDDSAGQQDGGSAGE
jgi:cell fate regulator YaaT (PSP1 superfamily)